MSTSPFTAEGKVLCERCKLYGFHLKNVVGTDPDQPKDQEKGHAAPSGRDLPQFCQDETI